MFQRSWRKLEQKLLKRHNTNLTNFVHCFGPIQTFREINKQINCRCMKDWRDCCIWVPKDSRQNVHGNIFHSGKTAKDREVQPQRTRETCQSRSPCRGGQRAGVLNTFSSNRSCKVKSHHVGPKTPRSVLLVWVQKFINRALYPWVLSPERQNFEANE